MGLSLTNFFVLARDNNTHAPEEWDYSEARPAAFRVPQARSESGLHRRYRANRPNISGVHRGAEDTEISGGIFSVISAPPWLNRAVI